MSITDTLTDTQEEALLTAFASGAASILFEATNCSAPTAINRVYEELYDVAHALLHLIGEKTADPQIDRLAALGFQKGAEAAIRKWSLGPMFDAPDIVGGADVDLPPELETKLEAAAQRYVAVHLRPDRLPWVPQSNLPLH